MNLCDMRFYKEADYGFSLVRYSCLLLCLTCCMNLSAQTDTVPTREHHLEGVTIESHRTDRQVTASKPIQLLTKEELRQLGLQNLADAVKKFAGAQVKDYGGIGGMKTVSVRNLGAHHTAVSYDDVTISNTQAGQIDINRYTLDNVESITLSVGSEDNWLQSARHYASGGVLSIKSERQGRDGKQWEWKLKGASFGYVSPSFRYWQPISSGTTIALNGSFMRADGQYPYTLVNGREKTREKRHNTDISSWQGEANLYHTWNDQSQLDVKACWYYSDRGLPGAVILYKDEGNERLWDEDFFTQAVFTHRFHRQLTLKARMKYAHSWNKYKDYDMKYENGVRTDVARQNEYYGSVTLGWRATDWLTFALAEDMAFNNLRSNITISDNLTDPPYPKRTTSLTALSANLEWQRLRVNANVVGTYATESVEAGKQPEDQKRLSPSLSVSYRLLKNEHLFLRAMYKNTFRMPTFNDLYYIRMGNTGLRPENAHEMNVGVTWSGRPVKLVKYLTVTIDGYLNKVTDKIVAFPSTYVWKMANFGQVTIEGVDVTLATEIPVMKIAKDEEVSLLLTGSYTNLKAVDKEDRSPTYDHQLPYTPRQSGNASVLLRTPWLHLGYNVFTQGKRWSNVQTTPQYALKAYWEHSLSLSHEFRLKACCLELQATVHNLTDEQYEIIKYYPMPGRSFSASATLRF